MRILIVTVGTRGDLQPLLALALGLQSAGHDVALCTHERYATTIRDAGLGYAFLNNDTLALLLYHPRATGLHHGGGGTTHTALREGKPTLVCPFFGDQPYWARQVQRLGRGLAPIPAAKLNAKRLAAALREMTGSARMQARAAEVGRAIRAENGVAHAVRFLKAMR